MNHFDWAKIGEDLDRCGCAVLPRALGHRKDPGADSCSRPGRIPVHHRPVTGGRGVYRVNMRHGVSRIRGGQRHTLGIIFHDAL